MRATTGWQRWRNISGGRETVLQASRMSSSEKLPTAVICLSSGKGGMELYALKIARMLAPKVPVTLVCKEGTFLEKSGRQEKDEAGFDIWPVHFRSRTFSPATIVSVKRLLRRKTIRNVIFLGASELKSLYFAFQGNGMNVIQRHATHKSRPKKDWFHRLVYTCVNHHVSISYHLSRNVREIIPIRAGATETVIYPSFPLPLVKRNSSDRVELLHVGRFVRGKGQLDAIKACRGLAENAVDFRFRLLGDAQDPVYADEISRYLDSSGYKDRVELVGFTRDVAAYLREADVFLYPSYGEGFGNAVNEALTAGLIPIVYENTVFPELREHGFHLHLVPDRNIEELTSRLVYVAQHVLEEKQAALANRKIAERLYSPASELKSWLQLLK